LTLKSDKTLSNVAFKRNLRRYNEVPAGRVRVLAVAVAMGPSDRCRHAMQIAAEQAWPLRHVVFEGGYRRANR
jgi:hypothetical protein